MITLHPIVCQTCGKTFHKANRYHITTNPVKYCSRTCSRKFKINHHYFETITSQNQHTFGQIIATSFILDRHTIIVRSNPETLEKIQTKISSEYPIKKSEQGKFLFRLNSDQMVGNMIDHGLVKDPIFQEYPPYDILSGLLDTDCYKELDGKKTFKHTSYKLVLEVQRLVGGEIYSETFKDVPRGVLGCLWVLVW
jgi:hypothetical protein